MNNLAVSYAALGRHAEALKLHEETLALRKARLGPDHPDTLASMSNLAISYEDLGRPPRPSSSARRRWRCEGQARPRPPRHAREHEQPGQQLRRPRPARRGPQAPRGDAGAGKARLGPDHPDTLVSMTTSPSATLRSAGTPRPSSSTKRRWRLRKAKLGPDHPDTLWSMHNLANIYADLGRHAEALKLREETLAVRKAKLGPDHPDTLWSMNDLAGSYGVAGRHAEALKLARRDPGPSARAEFWPDHPETLWSMHHLATSYAAVGRHAEALKLREETLALRKAKFGPDRPSTLWSMNDLVDSYLWLPVRTRGAVAPEGMFHRQAEGHAALPEGRRVAGLVRAGQGARRHPAADPRERQGDRRRRTAERDGQGVQFSPLRR